MATKSGGLFRLDAICAKLKQNKLATTNDEEANYSQGASKDSETNNNISNADDDNLNDSSENTHSNGEQAQQVNEDDEKVHDLSSRSTPIPDAQHANEADVSTELIGAAKESLNNASCSPESGTQSIPTPDTGSSRRSRRKNQKPKNIFQYQDQPEINKDCDDIEDYVMNNEGVDFNEMNGGDENATQEDMVLDLSATKPSQARKVGADGGQDQLVDQDESTSFSTDDFGAMDLSKPRQTPPVADRDDLSSQASDLSSSCGSVSKHPKSGKSQGINSSEAAEIKHYAENTMNELLSMYGLEDEQGEGPSIASDVPLKNFASILERQKIAGSHPIPESISDALKVKLITKRPPAAHQGMTGFSQGYSASVAQRLAPLSNSNSPLPASDSDQDSKIPSSGSGFMKSFDPSGAHHIGSISPGGKGIITDYGKYVKKFNSYEECGGPHCKDMGYKEHFHCLDCGFRVFVKKEEMIRHFKWHKKRDESLQHGFMRYSPMDDCSKKFPPCTHNGRQTHYHCLQPGCTKVYISTSDVQMHANYHRKDSAIIQEGFQRFRATEDCGTVECSFYGQRTTHFHCRRPGCKFTFKNKADMEKHKTYHQKDEILAKDGFKKFMKYESCSYQTCRYSKVSNHIHCIRPGCDYVLHSTGQLFSHKRKHERRDFEHAYKRFKDDQKQKAVINPAIRPMLAQHMAMQVQMANAQQQSAASKATSTQQPPMAVLLSKDKEYVDLEDLAGLSHQESSNDSDFESQGASDLSSSQGIATSSYSKPPGVIEIKPEGLGSQAQPSTLAKLASKLQGSNLGDSLNLHIEESDRKETEIKAIKIEPVFTAAPPISQAVVNAPPYYPKVSPPVNEKRERDESWKKYLTRYTANDPCNSRCQFLYKDHYHCNVGRCNMLFKSKDGVREHAKHHEQQDRITTLSFMIYDEGIPCVTGCPHNKIRKHYHCLWPECKQVVTDEDPVFNRLEHHKIHEFARNSMGRKSMNAMMSRSPDNFKRKRGRPPKYPKNVIPVVPKMEMTDEEINGQSHNHPGDVVIANGFCRFGQGEPCPDDKCMYFLKEHFHCLRQRCHHATDRTDMLNLHAKDFHSYINIIEGFEFFDRNVNCRRPHCHNNRANRHFHCVKPKCDYSFVRYSTMAQHDKKHKMAEMGLTHSPSIGIPRMAVPSMVVPGMAAQVPATSAAASQAALATDKNSTVKAAGTFFPISTIPKGNGQVLVSSADGGAVRITNNPPVMVSIPSVGGHIPCTMSSLQTGIPPIVIAPVSSSSSSSNLVTIAPKPSESADGFPDKPMPNALPLSALLQQKSANIPQLNWLTMKMRMHYGVAQNCGRPFCKLKKKDHYHCFECNQAFSDPIRLKGHVTKHGLKLDAGEQMEGRASGSASNRLPESVEGQYTTESDEDAADNGDGLNPNSSLNLNPHAFTSIMNQGQQQQQGADSDSDEGDLVMDLSKIDQEQVNDQAMDEEPEMNDEDELSPIEEPAMEGVDEAPLVEEESNSPSADKEATPEPSQESQDGVNPARRSRRKRTATKHDDFVDSDAALSKIRRISSPRASKDDSTPEGYTKYKFNDDCAIERCAYRQNMTHYHCDRNDCAYSFNDRSRFVQHNEKHKRLDDLMGDEFHQFSLKIDCGRGDCEHARKASHFHCAVCPFICTDTNKVSAHRKHHAKLKDIAAQGFAKFTAGEVCSQEKCSHSQKQTHYHCTHAGCGVAAMGPAQINAHAVKHQPN